MSEENKEFIDKISITNLTIEIEAVLENKVGNDILNALMVVLKRTLQFNPNKTEQKQALDQIYNQIKLMLKI